MLLNLALSPARGWEDINDDSPEPRRLLTHGFLPLLVLTALSSAMQLLYLQSWTWNRVVISAIISSGTFFISYYAALLLLGTILPHISASADSYSEARTSNFCVLAMSLLAVITIIKNCLPEGLPLVHFLPLYVIVIMWQGRDYLSIPAYNGVRFIITAVLAVMAPPLLLDIMFSFVNL